MARDPHGNRAAAEAGGGDVHPKTAPYVPRYYLSLLEAAAAQFRVELMKMPAQSPAVIEEAINGLAQPENAGLAIMPDSFALAHRGLILRLATKHQLPSISPYRSFTADGGLVSYGVDVRDLFRRSAAYVHRILKGDKPADLPVQQPTRFELVVNLKTAASLGLIVPPSILDLADEVIE
jgi:putative ABC transport system substrate-binding protein